MTTRTLSRTATALLTLLCSLLLLGPSQANSGDLDDNFGFHGRVATSFGRLIRASCIAIQEDGEIVVGGVASGDTSTAFAIRRFHPKGNLDLTFGLGGGVMTEFGPGGTALHKLAIQGDGKIVAAGTTYSGKNGGPDFALVRYNSDGSLDETFGSGGKVETDFFGLSDLCVAVVLQPDGRIVTAGHAFTDNGEADFALARYNADGTLDETFGSSGKVTTDFSAVDSVAGLVLGDDGKLVAAGVSFFDGDTLLARYNGDGSLDSTFGSAGKIRANFFTSPVMNKVFVPYALVMQSDGKLVIGGHTALCVYCGNPGDWDFGLFRFNADGSLDLSFGSAGRISTDFGGSETCVALALQPDGKIVAGGSTDVLNVSDFAMARYRTDGSLDRSLGSRGKVVTDFFGNADRLNALAIQPNGMIVAAGEAVTAAGTTAGFCRSAL